MSCFKPKRPAGGGLLFAASITALLIVFFSVCSFNILFILCGAALIILGVSLLRCLFH